MTLQRVDKYKIMIEQKCQEIHGFLSDCVSRIGLPMTYEVSSTKDLVCQIKSFYIYVYIIC